MEESGGGGQRYGPGGGKWKASRVHGKMFEILFSFCIKKCIKLIKNYFAIALNCCCCCCNC